MINEINLKPSSLSTAIERLLLEAGFSDKIIWEILTIVEEAEINKMEADYDRRIEI